MASHLATMFTKDRKIMSGERIVRTGCSSVSMADTSLGCSRLSAHEIGLLEIVEHCGGELEQAANMHMNRLSFTLKLFSESVVLMSVFMHDPYLKQSQPPVYKFVWSANSQTLMVGP